MRSLRAPTGVYPDTHYRKARQMTDHAAELRRLDAEAAERTRDEARRYLAMVLDDINDPEQFPRDGSYTYDTRRLRAVGFMLAVNGPTVYAWFVLDGGEVHHAHLSHTDDRARDVFVDVDDRDAQRLYDALRADARAREDRDR